MCCSLVSNTNGPKTLLGIRINHGGLGSLFVTLVWASGILWSSTRGSFGWRWQVCVCTAATSLPVILSKSSKLRSSSLIKPSERLVGGLLLRAISIVSRPNGEMVARNDLIVLNRGGDLRFIRGVGGGVDYRPHDCRAWSCLTDRRLVRPRGNNLE